MGGRVEGEREGERSEGGVGKGGGGRMWPGGGGGKREDVRGWKRPWWRH